MHKLTRKKEMLQMNHVHYSIWKQNIIKTKNPQGRKMTTNESDRAQNFQKHKKHTSLKSFFVHSVILYKTVFFPVLFKHKLSSVQISQLALILVVPSIYAVHCCCKLVNE